MATNNKTFNNQPRISADGKPDTSKVAGKSVIITGAASGLGEAMARAYTAAGAFVTMGDVNEEAGLKLATELGGDKKATFVKCDVRVWKDQLKLFKTAMERSPSKGIDIVLANAGVITQETFEDVPTANDFDPPEPDFTTINITLIGMLYTAKLALHFLQLQPESPNRDRCLIMTDSISGYVDHPTLPQYSISKWGIRGFMRSMRRTVPAKGVRINILAPWYTRTHILPEAVWDAVAAGGASFADAADVAAASLHFACDRSLNGRALAVLPRDVHAGGYIDLGEDDYVEGSTLARLQVLVAGS